MTDNSELSASLAAQSAEMGRTLEAVATNLGLDRPDLEIVKSPCNGFGLTDKDRVDIYYRGTFSASIPFAEMVHQTLNAGGWDYDDSVTDATHYVYARRQGMTLEVGRLKGGSELSLVGRSTCV